MYPFPGNLLVARPEYHWRKGRFIHRRRFAELQENFVVDIKCCLPVSVRKGTSRSIFVVNGEYRLPILFDPLNTGVGMTSRGWAVILWNVMCSAARSAEMSFSRTPVSSSADSQARRDTLPFVAEDRFKMASAAFLAV